MVKSFESSGNAEGALSDRGGAMVLRSISKKHSNILNAYNGHLIHYASQALTNETVP